MPFHTTLVLHADADKRLSRCAVPGVARKIEISVADLALHPFLFSGEIDMVLLVGLDWTEIDAGLRSLITPDMVPGAPILRIDPA